MSFASDQNTKQTASRWLAAAVAAAMLAVLLLMAGPVPHALAASCNGKSHTPSLSSGRVSPSSGTPSTIFDFAVRYVDSGGCAPSTVVVTISGVGPIPMTASGSNWQSGATFRVSRRLAVGSHTYTFTATSGSGGGAKTVTLSSVSPGKIVVKPAPTPKPTPKPKPKATPKPTAKPRSSSKPKPTKKPIAPTAPPDATSDPTSRATDDADPTDSQPPIAIVLGPGPLDRGGPWGGSSGPSVPGGGLGGGPFDGIPWSWSVLVTTFSALIGIGLFIWLASRPRRRAEERAGPMDPHDIVFPTPDLPAGSALIAIAATAAPESPIAEMTMPRWRRPSLQAARKSSTRDIPDHVPLVFAAPAEASEERARVTYRLVRVYDQPDEVRGLEVAWLDRGDEVDVVSQQGSYTFIRTPSGAAGWVHRTTLRRITEDDALDTAFGGPDITEDDPPGWSIIH